MEKYLVLNPDGRMKWIHTKHKDICATFRQAIGCEMLENVSLPYGFCCVVDEFGKVRQDPQPVNQLASRFYPGTMFGDPLVGPVVFCRIGLFEGEPDWLPLTKNQLSIVELVTGKRVPDED